MYNCPKKKTPHVSVVHFAGKLKIEFVNPGCVTQPDSDLKHINPLNVSSLSLFQTPTQSCEDPAPM